MISREKCSWEAGAVLVRAGRGHGSDVISMEGLNRQFQPWTLLVHATDAIKPILESGSLVSGISLNNEGRNLIHFSPIPASVIQQASFFREKCSESRDF